MEYKLKQSTIPTASLTLVEKVFVNRGIALQDIEHYLHTTDDDILPPERLKNMRQGAMMLAKHLKDNSHVLIQVDPDCDGMTSAALLFNYLYRLFPAKVLNNFSYRLHDGKQHGLIYETIPDDVKLVIAPDSSSNDLEIHQKLAEKGIDVLVLDHHLAPVESEYACVINNQMCDYPTKSLSGVGIVYKFCCYLDKMLGVDVANDFVDLASVGLVGDMMDVRDFETKRIIDRGLVNLVNPFISEMHDSQEFSISRHGGYDIYSITFYIVPYINAVIRSGTAEDKELLFNALLEFKAHEMIPSTKRGCNGQEEELVTQAIRNCKNVKNRQTKENELLTTQITKIIKDNNLLDNKILIVPVRQGLIANKNLTGLVANQLARTYARPTLILNETYDEAGQKIWAGSGRNCENSKIENLNEFLYNTGLTLEVAGHENAFGISVLDCNFDEFIHIINDTLALVEFTNSYQVDAIYENQDCNSSDILQIANLKSIWGQCLSEPYIAIQNLVVLQSRVQILSREKCPTLKITLTNGIELIKFSLTEEEINIFDNIGEGCLRMNLVGTCDKNVWNGNVTPQIKITEYEITGHQAFCF